VLVVVAMAAALAGPAAATQFPPVEVRIEAEPGLLPVPGQVFRFALEFEAHAPLDLVTADLESDRDSLGQRHWEVVLFDAPSEVPLVPGSPLRIDCEVLCHDATQPLRIAYRAGAFEDRRTFFLLPRVSGAAETIVEEEEGGPAPDARALVRPEPAARPAVAPKDRPGFVRREAAPLAATEPDEEEREGSSATAFIRTAHGKIKYRRADNWKLVGADGVTVRLYDEDSGTDDFLGQTVTDSQGYFEISFLFPSGDPDLYFEFEAANARVEIEYPAVGDPNYAWTTGTAWNQGGSVIDLHTTHPSVWSEMPILHMVTQLSRQWRELHNMGYGGIPTIDVRTPDSDWPHYKAFFGEIYIPSGWMWDDGTLWHEYGHHFIEEFGSGSSTDYCNAGNRCDDPGEDCRHCIWCQETALDAWNEGFPDYFSDLMTRVIAQYYAGQGAGDAVEGYDFEVGKKCSTADGGNNAFDDPSKTEGILAALLRDLDDGGAQDVDDLGNGIGKDRLSGGPGRVFATTVLDQPSTAWGFIDAYRARYPENIQELWSTCYNNGFNFDQAPPGVVSGLDSPSHPTSGPWPDATIEYTWTPPYDDASGAGGYSVWIGPAPTLPDATVDIGAVTSLETGQLAPGTYWFSIRAVDVVGNWSPSFATHGPIEIRDPYPADLLPNPGPGYAHALVPRNAPLAILGIAPEPAFLARSPLYLNLSTYNNGELATVGAFEQWAWLDGKFKQVAPVAAGDPIAPGDFLYQMNLGPLVAPGGRHTLAMMADGGEDLAEGVESTNFYAKQWIFAPHAVTAASPFVGATPVLPYAGWFGGAPLFTSPNCTGLRMDASGEELCAMVLLPLETGDDYDLRSHAMSLGALSGFHNIGSYAYSMRDSACIDAVLVSPSEAFADVWDVGVLNHNPASRLVGAGFEARRVGSVELVLDSVHVVNWSANEPLSLFHHAITGRLVRDRVIEVFADPAIGPLHIGLYANGTDHAALDDRIAIAHTDETGHATLAYSDELSTHPITVWRDPRDAPGGALPLAATSFTIRVRNPYPDLEPAQLAGWSLPLVPHPAPDGTPTSVYAPTILYGDATQTWLNWAFRNAGTPEADSAESRVYLDGDEVAAKTWPAVAGGADVAWNDPTPIHVRGGRHTLSLRLDTAASLVEELEGNNVHGWQWSWRPPEFAPGAPVSRVAPPAPTAGWADVLAGGFTSLHYDSDGLRTPAPVPAGEHGHWQALAAMPGGASDVDLRLHEATDHPAFGFGDPLVVSVFGTGQSDYVLTNFRVTTPRPFDVGVVGVSGSESYTADVVGSQFLASLPQGGYGPFELAANRIVALHEVELPAGPLMVSLANAGGTLDWGLSLHRANLPLQSKSTPMANGDAWTEGAGAGEAIGLDIPETGRYCVAVWKAFAADLANAGQYTLHFGSGVVGTSPGGVPGRTAFTAVVPNPFRPSTALRFDLAREGHVELRLYDVNGREVRTLLAGRQPAGRHEAVWDGADDSGRPVTSGIYFARLVADATAWNRKLVLLE